MKPIKIYLAVPYSFNPEFSFRIANKVAARLMSDGYVVFSPISQGHPIADYLPDGIRTDSEWWLKQCLPIVGTMDELHIISIGEEGETLIDNSVGCRAELKKAMFLGKRIRVIEVSENGEILRHRA